jgi:hypothetical protein
MFKKLIERIDSVNDYVNPIVVRDMRRAFCNNKITWGMIIYAYFVIVDCLLIYFLYDLDSFELKINKSATSFAFGAYLFTCALSIIFGGGMVFQCVARGLDDEMFHITAITPHQYLHAYMFEMFIFTSYVMSLLMPLVFIFFGRTLKLLIMAAIAFCGNILVAQIVILVYLSFIARLKHSNQIIIVVLFVFEFFYPIMFLFIVMVPYYIVRLPVWLSIDTSHTLSPPASRCNIALVWLSIDTSHTLRIALTYTTVITSLLLTGATAYRLSLYAFKTRRKSLIKMILLNIFCYTLLSVVMALIYFCIAFVVFNFM